MQEPKKEKQFKDPLPIEALKFGNVVHQLCGEACIAGSAPLAKYFYNLSQQNDSEQLGQPLQKILNNIDCNDVDVFAPLFPRKLAKGRASTTFHKLSRSQQARYLDSRHTHPKQNPTKIFTLMKCELGLWEHGLEMCDVQQKMFDQKGFCMDQCNIWNEAVNLGIRHIFNFKLRYCINKQPCNVQMQLILLDGHPRQGQSWQDFITGSFDIDIVRGTAKIDDITALGQLDFEPYILDKIHSGVFTYNIRNCIDLDTLVSRIQKYLKRGFQLDNLEFADDCCKLFRLHVMRKLRYHLTSTICYKWFDDSEYPLGVATAVIPIIKQYVQGPAYEKRIFRAMQLEEMRRKFDKNNWWSVGFEKICKHDFENVIRREQTTRWAVLCIERAFLAWKTKNTAKKPTTQLLGKRKQRSP